MLGEPQPWPALSDGWTHVWALDIAADAPDLAALGALLSQDESERAGRFRFEPDRLRFVATRAMLRTILGRYANLAPDSLKFSYSAFGKPALAPSMDLDGLRFNVSGSDTLALVAVRLNAELGIDIERVRSVPNLLEVARRMLRIEECDEFTSLPEALRERRFFEYWVRKEALAKLLGKGLRQSFNSLSLRPWPGDNARRVGIDQDGGTVNHWVIPIAAPHGDFVSALASSQPIGRLRYLAWEPRTHD